MQMLSMTPSTRTPQQASPAPPPRCLTQPAATPLAPTTAARHAREVGAATERARLARELHDAVLPALFSLDLPSSPARHESRPVRCGNLSYRT